LVVTRSKAFIPQKAASMYFPFGLRESFCCFVNIMPLQKRNHLSLYWKCQLIGWSLASLYWQVDAALTGRYDIFFGMVQFASDVVMYILLTHLYRILVRRAGWTTLSLEQLVYRLAAAVLLMGLCFAVMTMLKIYALRLLFGGVQGGGFLQFVHHNGSAVFIGGLRMMGIWILAYHLYHFAMAKIAMAKANAQLEVLSRQAQLDSLSSQLNPHFLFNSLNTIKSLVSAKPQVARRGIDLLAELLRSALYPRHGAMSTLGEEMALVEDYLELESLRLEERLTVEKNIDRSLLELPIPRFSVQSLVENAIKHGISAQKAGGTIVISVSSENDQLHIDVSNPGKLSGTDGSGIGLCNLRGRLRLHYGGKASLQIDSNLGVVHCKITVPLP
jgi:hypothetical protein